MISFESLGTDFRLSKVKISFLMAESCMLRKSADFKLNNRQHAYARAASNKL